MAKGDENHPSAAKAVLNLLGLAYGLKPVPFNPEFFRKL
jgi:hypothetical protein